MSGQDPPVYTFNDDQEIPYAVLNNALTRLVSILDKPLIGKENFPPVKVKKEHIEFMMKETLLNKIEAEGLLTRAGGDIEAAIKLFLESPLNTSFKL